MSTHGPDDALPRELADLERALRARPRPAPGAALRGAVLAELERARLGDGVRERTFALAAAAAIALYAWGVNSLVPDRESATLVARVDVDRRAFAELGFGPDEADRIDLARRLARIQLIAPTVGGDAATDAHVEGG